MSDMNKPSIAEVVLAALEDPVKREHLLRLLIEREELDQAQEQAKPGPKLD